MARHDEHLTRFMKLAILVSLFTSTITSHTFAQGPYQRRAQKFEMPELGIANPAGVAFSPAAKALIVAPSQGSAELVFVSFDRELVDAVTVATAIPDPINMAFDGKSNRLLFFDASLEELVEIKARPNGRPLPSPGALTRFNASAFGVKEAKGITFDHETGNLFILVVPAPPAEPRVVRIIPDARDRFASPVVSDIALNSLSGSQLRGIAFNPNDGHFYIMSPAEQKLYEVTQAGEVLTTRDISLLELPNAQNMVFAPSGDQTDDPALLSLYIADSGLSSAQGHGDITELSLTKRAVQDLSAITAQASLVRTVLASQWSPPSPDPSGIAYNSSSNTLIVSDGEVDEMSIYAGVNYWEVTLSGNQVNKYKTTAFSDEPTGVAYNPSNRHLFFTDDTGTRSVYELNPGSDGRYGTSDDVVTSFETGDFGCEDPEGIAYDTFQGHLFIADGSNAEVWEISPGANGRFNGVPPNGDDVMVQHFDTARLGLDDPEGIEFNTDNGNLYIVSRSNSLVVETKRTGTAVDVIDIGFLNARSPAGLAYAPSSANPSEKSLYIVARGVDNDSNPNENDGKMYEISLGDGGGGSSPSVAINDIVVTEGNAGTVNAQFTVTLSGTSSQTVTVNYATADGSATAGSDYVAASGQVSFSPGQTSRPVTVAVNGDVLVEPNEAFLVNLSNAVNATIGDNQGTGTINDDDTLPSLAINDVAVTEGNSGAVNAIFTVTLSRTSDQTVTVSYATANGTATAGSDYVAASGPVSFSPGQTSRLVTVMVNGDVLDEPNETFLVNLSNAVNATIGDNQGTGTINDDDATPSLAINDVVVTEGNSGTVNAVFAVTLSAASGQTVTVKYATANGSARASKDYVSASEQVSFSPGQTSRLVTVAVIGDGFVELNETFVVNLKNGVNATIGDKQGACTINNDDGALSIEATALSTETLPQTITLNPNYPNPFNLETRIEYALPEPGQVRLAIYNLIGQEVRTLADEIQPAGFKRVLWNGRDEFGREVGSGVYFIQLMVGQQRFVRKISLLK